MNESLIQWTLLHNVPYLSKKLGFLIRKKVGQEISFEAGRIDFILEDSKTIRYLIELETIINSRAKLDYCITQTLNYKRKPFLEVSKYCILFADETNKKYQNYLNDFGRTNDIIIKKYSISEVKKLYSQTVEKLSLSFGLALPKPKNYTISYLRWLNKIMEPFSSKKANSISEIDLRTHFSQKSDTNFRCYKRLALDFEMFSYINKKYVLTPYGIDFISNLNPLINNTTSNLSTFEITLEQKRLLLKILTNGNWTVHKVNIYWFFRFIETTNGEWVPNIKDFDDERLALVNDLFGVNYKKRTMYELLNFTCNFCMELNLVERIRSSSLYDRVFLTPLGIEVNNIFSLDLSLKKTRMNLSFKYLD